MTKKERKALKRIGSLHRMAIGGGSPNEREQARKKLEAELKNLGKTWNDIPSLLMQEQQAELEEKQEQAAAQGATYNPATGLAIKPSDVSCIDLIDHMLRQYLDLKDHEFTAVTLWALHTHIFERFEHTPRLALMSPVADCGKSTVMAILSKLVARPELRSNTTAAAIYWLLDQGTRTLLLDEMDNADLLNNSVLRSVLNSGYQRSGSTIGRFIGGRSKQFSTFAPMALAAINTYKPLPWPILSRSLIVDMQRSKKPLRRYDSKDTEDLDIVRDQIWLWARSDPKLNHNPEMPAGLRVGRPQNNWRALRTRGQCRPKKIPRRGGWFLPLPVLKDVYAGSALGLASTLARRGSIYPPCRCTLWRPSSSRHASQAKPISCPPSGSNGCTRSSMTASHHCARERRAGEAPQPTWQ